MSEEAVSSAKEEIASLAKSVIILCKKTRRKKRMKKVVFVLLSIALIVVGLSACQSAPEGPNIEISGVWGRPSPMKAGNGATYFLIENK